jgi:hypothetical protein
MMKGFLDGLYWITPQQNSVSALVFSCQKTLIAMFRELSCDHWNNDSMKIKQCFSYLRHILIVNFTPRFGWMGFM